MKVMLSSDSIKKMTSDKAIQKSLDNGFSEAQHFEAVKDIKSLYENAILKESLDDLKHGDPAIKIHRFNSDFENENALTTIKESLDKDFRKIYSVELELNPKPLAKLGRNASKQGNANLTQTTASESLAPIEKHLDNSTIRTPTKDNDKINITAFPTTQINKVIGDIKKSNKVAEALERIQQTATPLQSNPSPQGAKNIIQQESKKPATKKPKKIKEVEKEADNFQSSSNPAGLLNPEESTYTKKL